MRYFKEAKNVERVIFTIQNAKSVLSNKVSGESIELRFDTKDVNNCFLEVQADISEWMDASFTKIKELLSTYKNRNSLVRSSWTPFIVQIFGLLIGFIFSLWAAITISPILSLEHAFVVTFVLAFLVFSNSWTYIYSWILKIIDFYWPNISFKDKKGFHWLIQALITTAFVALFILIFNKLFIYIGKLLESILK